MKLLARFILWRTRRRHLAHRRWLRHNQVVPLKPSPGCVVPNTREPLG